MAIVVLLLLSVGAWRFGWPPRSMETVVTRLEKITWLEAARLQPSCIPRSLSAGRQVPLLPGSLDEKGKPVFDAAKATFTEPGTLPARQKILSELMLPDLAEKSFYAGVFWVDMPPDHAPEELEKLEPAQAYAVLLACDKTRRWEQAAQLVLDLNRNRDLTDDPVMTISSLWADKVEFFDSKWFLRAFKQIELRRDVLGQDPAGDLPASVDVVPLLNASYPLEGETPNSIELAFLPASFRRGKVPVDGSLTDVVIVPDPSRLGRFDGSSVEFRGLGSDWYISSSDFDWQYDRGYFCGGILNGEGTELRTGPYLGPTGKLRFETAAGESLQIAIIQCLLHGPPCHTVCSSGWTPIPRFSWYTLPLAEQPLPAGEFNIEWVQLVTANDSWINISRRNATPLTFQIESDRSTTIRLPRGLKMDASANVEVTGAMDLPEQVWSSDPVRNAAIDPDRRALPQPGCQVTLAVKITDPATNLRYLIYPGTDSQGGPVQVAIRDETGNTVHESAMGYG